MNTMQQATAPHAVYVDNVKGNRGKNNAPTDENAEERARWVPTEALENKENWCPDTQVFVGGQRFSSPMEGKRRFGTVRKPLSTLKVTLRP